MSRSGFGSDWEDPQARPRRAGRLAVRVSGSAGRPVLLLHGLVGSSRYWGRRFERLAEDHRLLVPDLLGFGGSTSHTGPFTVDGHAAAVWESVDRLGVEGPVTIGAHSMGGVVALGMARARPGQTSAVVAFGPPIYPEPSSARSHVASGGLVERAMVLRGPWSKLACGWMCRHKPLARRIAPLLSPTLPAAVARDAVDHTWPSYSESLSQLLLLATTSRWLPEVRCPVALVAGDRDPVVDRAHLEDLAALPAVSFQTWPGDHHLPLRASDRCARLLSSAASG